MTAVVQASCPHCRSVLRIPADWLDKPMRCKFCKNTFEARARAADAPLLATPLPSTAMSATPLHATPLHAAPLHAMPLHAAPLHAAPVAATAVAASPVARTAYPGMPLDATAVSASPPARNADPFALDPEPFAQTPSVARRRRGVGSKLAVLGGCAVLLVAIALPVVVLAVVFGPGLLRQGDTDLALADKDFEPPLAKGDHAGHGDRPKQHSGRKEHAVKYVGPAKAKANGKEKKTPRRDKTGRPVEKSSGLLPRRALLISVDNYLYLNSVHYGSLRTERYPGSSPAALAASLPNPPMRIPATQVFQLSDGGRVPHPTELSVLKNAIKDFLDTSRAQDRIVILFAGHGTEIDKDAYLIPISGRKEKADTLLPLAWVYEQMAKCKARQKVLILDLFRFPPALGFELPGAGASEEGEMGEVFDKKLQEPPAGVQVWSSCIKDQRSIEFEGGSVFLQALNQTLQKGPAMTGFIEGSSPLPFDTAFVDKVNQHIKEQIGGQKLVQTSRIVGSPAADGAAYNPAEPLAQPITLKQPTMPGGGAASYAEINSILDELRMVPPTRTTRSGEDRLLQATNLPPFPEKVLASYKLDDYKSIGDVLKAYKNDPKPLTEKHPIRAAVLDAVDKLRESDKIVMRETLNGPINAKQKTAFLAEQTGPGVTLFELERSLRDMRAVAEADMEKETSKRWRANFEYTQARLKSRIVYIYEYSYLLGQIRQDALPPLENGNDGWRVGSRKKIQVTEPIAKKYAKDVAKAWGKIQKEYPDTPWAVMAYRESMVTLGLEWRAKKE